MLIERKDPMDEAVLKEQEESKFVFMDAGRNPVEFLHKGQVFKIHIKHFHSGRKFYGPLKSKNERRRSELWNHPIHTRSKPARYVTHAHIMRADGGKLAFIEARCHPNDNPSRKLGRKIALNRAVKWIEENF